MPPGRTCVAVSGVVVGVVMGELSRSFRESVNNLKLVPDRIGVVTCEAGAVRPETGRCETRGDRVARDKCQKVKLGNL